MENKNVTSIALHKDFINKITLHNTEYYDAIENGVSRVHILDGRIAHCLLLEIFTNKGIGTAILGDSDNRFYNEDK